MAKSRQDGHNKSQAIRDLLAANPKTSTKDIVAQLSGQGLKVQPSLIYMVKSKLGLQRRRAKRQQVQAASQRYGADEPIQLVRKVKVLADDAGGIRNLKMLVDLLAE